MVKNPPSSGSEHIFTTRKWGGPVGKNNNNCYAYAVHDFQKYRNWKSQPGERASMNSRNLYHGCGKLPKKVLSDNPKKVYKSTAGEKCKPSYYKIMLFVAKCKKRNTLCQGDFHFYKQHSKTEYKIKAGDTHESVAKFFKVPVYRIKRATTTMKPGKIITFKAEFFSHKRGWATGPLITGATGKLIRDPRRTSRKYESINYNKYCGSFCVKNQGIKVGHTHSKVAK